MRMLVSMKSLPDSPNGCGDGEIPRRRGKDNPLAIDDLTVGGSNSEVKIRCRRDVLEMEKAAPLVMF